MEINNRSVILDFYLDKSKAYAKGLDLPPDVYPRYQITYSIPDMAKLSGTESLAEDMKDIITVDAPTIGKALEELQTKTKNTLTLSHVKALLVGEDLLKSPDLFKEALESIDRERVFARNTPVLAVEGEAASVAQMENPQHPIIGLYIMHYFNNKERPVSAFKHQLLGNFTRDLEDTGVATMPVFHIQEEDQIAINGGALIKDYAFVDYLTKEEVRGQLLIDGEVKMAPIVIEYQNAYLTYMLKSQKSKIRFEQTPYGISAKVEIDAEGNITEYKSMPGEEGFTKQQEEEIKTLLQQEIQRQVQEAIDKSKELEVDFLKIGLEMYRTHPKWWEEYKEGWQEGGYMGVPVSVAAKVEIKNTGVSN
jgi:Ger(x)C family germination protein